MSTQPARVLVVQHGDDVGLGRFAPLLAGHGVDVDVVRPDRGQRQPSAAGAHDAVIVLGGHMAAWEDDQAPWLPATRELIRSCVADAVPYLGVCLGAQLLGLACGGRVDRGPAGLEVGLVDVAFTAAAHEDPVFRAVAAQLGPAVQGVGWHRDAVLDLPADAVLLGGGARYAHQAFRVGRAAWGVQYHPEVTPEGVASWASATREAVAEAGADPAVLLAEISAAEPELARLAAAHVDAFVAVVRHNLSRVAVVDQV